MSEVASSTAGASPAGWYPDPSVPGSERYFDGVQWTDQTRPLAQQSTPAASSAGPILGGFALGVGIAAFVLSWVPVLGLLLAAAAVVLGALALRPLARAGKSRAPALTGLILGAVAFVAAIVWFLVVFVLSLGNATGSFSSPLPSGRTVQVASDLFDYRYEITLGSADWDAAPEQVGAEEPAGEGFQYVVVPVTVTNTGTADLPLWNLLHGPGSDLEFITSNGQAHDSLLYGPPETWGVFDDLVPNATQEGAVGFRVPEGTTSGVWRVGDNYIAAD